MRIVFLGSDDFATVHLEQLLKSRHTVVGCVTTADARQGRGLRLVLSPIKDLAGAHGIDCIQPETLKDPVVDWLRKMAADVFVVVAYGKILTRQILDIPRIFCVNVHGSLLPRYRGAAPINWAIINGDQHTGVTVQKMVWELDAGGIIAQAKVEIAPDITAGVLRAQMAQVGAKLLIEALDDIEAGKHCLTPQDPVRVTYAPKLTKGMGHVDWNKSAQVIYDQVRGLKPWPGTYTFFKGKTLKITDVAVAVATGKPGEVIAVDKQGFSVACGKGALIIKEVQPESGKVMPASSFMRGHQLREGLFLGS